MGKPRVKVEKQDYYPSFLSGSGLFIPKFSKGRKRTKAIHGAAVAGRASLHRCIDLILFCDTFIYEKQLLQNGEALEAEGYRIGVIDLRKTV